MRLMGIYPYNWEEDGKAGKPDTAGGLVPWKAVDKESVSHQMTA